MSSRQLRKALQRTTLDTDTQRSDTDTDNDTNNTHNAFDLLIDNHTDNTSDSDHELKQHTPDVDDTHLQQQHNNKKKKKQKKKKKKKAAAPSLSQEPDPIPILPDIIEQAQHEDTPVTDTEVKTTHVLSVNPNFFNPQKELVRMFGSSTLNSVRSQTDEDSSRPTKSKVKTSRTTLRKSFLVEPKSHWPPLSPIDIKDIRFTEKSDSKEQTILLLEPNEEYRRQQLEFIACVETFDPQAIVFMVSKYPYHVDSLLQLADIYKHNGELKVAADLIERAIYRLEASLPPNFLGKASVVCLDFISGRSFYVAFYKHLHYVGRQGCSRTALEFCKLLLSLSPPEDPLAVLSFIDHFALRSKEYDFLFRLCDSFSLSQFKDSTWGDASGKLLLLPNFAFSIALAKFFVEQTSSLLQDDNADFKSGNFFSSPQTRSSKNLLMTAVLLFPEMVLPLMKKASDRESAREEWALLSSHYLFNTHTANLILTKLVEKYVLRNHLLWNGDAVLDWLRTTVLEMTSMDELKSLLDLAAAYRQVYSTPNPLLLNFAKLPEDDDISILDEAQLPHRRVTAENIVNVGGRALDLNSNPLQAFFESLLPWVRVPTGQDAGPEQKE